MSDYHYNNEQDNGTNPNFTQVSEGNERYPSYYGPTEPQQPKKPKKKGIAGIIAAMLAVGIIAGSLLTGFVVVPALNKAVEAQQQEEQARAEADGLVQDAAVEEMPQVDLGGEAKPVEDYVNPVPEVVENVQESVVGIATYNKAYASGQEPIEEAVSSGTGIVISAEGHILTNNHVVENGNRIKVTTFSGEEHYAELVGRDENTETAVIKVEGLGLDPIPLGDSDKARTGEMVIAIGNPLGQQLSNTVTVGYLSSVSREIQNPNRISEGETMNMLQTDAAINPGNSGGPLLNTNGEVIGINTMKTSTAGYSQYGESISAEGLGFAIPINDAKAAAEELIQYGSVQGSGESAEGEDAAAEEEQGIKPGIGFSYQVVTPEDAKLWESPRGIVVQYIIQGSPADQAGLMVSDIITELDGVDLTGGADAPTFESRSVGDTVTAKVWRDGQELDLEFVLVDLNELESQQQQQQLPW
ncbi:trypsin-like peptidase domain-containing protein [Christensenellaceae bacterium OttesenSCG-928-K19]|nr:trypsin-like peptidase domain-containing protein [Christensenellaceae bacterium OttesenSCG-928-K19]